MIYLGWLGRRVPDRRLIAHAGVYMWLLPLITVLGLPLLFAGPIRRPRPLLDAARSPPPTRPRHPTHRHARTLRLIRRRATDKLASPPLTPTRIPCYCFWHDAIRAAGGNRGKETVGWVIADVRSSVRPRFEAAPSHVTASAPGKHPRQSRRDAQRRRRSSRRGSKEPPLATVSMPKNAFLHGRWTIEDSARLYGMADWGKGYFGVNPHGHVTVMPDQEPRRTDRPARPGRRPGRPRRPHPRAHPLLRHPRAPPPRDPHRLRQGHRRERSTAASYSCVYPIKVNQQRHVCEEIANARPRTQASASRPAPSPNCSRSSALVRGPGRACPSSATASRTTSSSRPSSSPPSSAATSSPSSRSSASSS